MAKAKRVTGAEADGPADGGMTLVLNTRLEEMCALRDAALDWSDPEGVHDMRVASRRLRGALRDFMPYLAKPRLAACLRQIRNIAQALGQVRDYDVAIMTLEEIAEKAPPEVAEGIRRLVQLRSAAREAARVKLIPAIDPESLLALRAKFTEGLNAATAARPQTIKSAKHETTRATNLSYRDVGRSIILVRLDQLEKLSGSLYHPLKIKPLHEMRIAAKHLRYAVELFEQCWEQRLTFFAKKVAGLQSSLGKQHDCDVWLEDLGDDITSGKLPLDFDHKATSLWLLSHFVKLRGKHLGKALTQWNEWESEKLSARLREAITPSSVAGGRLAANASSPGDLA